MDATIELAKALIEKPSITPDDCGCQDLIISRLQNSDFIATNCPIMALAT